MSAPQPLTIAVLGMGEAGGALARDLVQAGATVRGYDPVAPGPPGIIPSADEADAVRGAAVVLSVNSASAAVAALRAGLEAIDDSAVWADLNTASPGAKRALAHIAGERGVAFADVAIMAPVPGRGLRVPMLATGAARPVADALNAHGAAVEVMPGEPGDAAERKLLRSVFFKGLAAAVYEALEAGRAAGCEEWLRQNIVQELTAADAATVDRLVSGTVKHAVRRRAEMAAATRMLRELDVTPSIAAASHDLLQRLATESAPSAESAPAAGSAPEPPPP